MQPEPTQDQKQAIKDDYEEWTRGFAPADENEIDVYVTYARDPKHDPDSLRAWLLTQVGEWTEEEGAREGPGGHPHHRGGLRGIRGL